MFAEGLIIIKKKKNSLTSNESVRREKEMAMGLQEQGLQVGACVSLPTDFYYFFFFSLVLGWLLTVM